MHTIFTLLKMENLNGTKRNTEQRESIEKIRCNTLWPFCYCSSIYYKLSFVQAIQVSAFFVAVIFMLCTPVVILSLFRADFRAMDFLLRISRWCCVGE